MTGGASVRVRTGRARRATGRLVPRPHKLQADPQQAPQVIVHLTGRVICNSPHVLHERTAQSACQLTRFRRVNRSSSSSSSSSSGRRNAPLSRRLTRRRCYTDLTTAASVVIKVSLIASGATKGYNTVT
jgi:hypothetical protein